MGKVEVFVQREVSRLGRAGVPSLLSVNGLWGNHLDPEVYTQLLKFLYSAASTSSSLLPFSIMKKDTFYAFFTTKMQVMLEKFRMRSS